MEKLKYVVYNPFTFVVTKLLRFFPYFSFLFKTAEYQCRVSLWFWVSQKLLNLGGNKDVYWPVHSTSNVVDYQKILVGIDVCPGLMRGCYIQGKGGIEIDDYTQIGPNVVIISANHDIYDSRKHIEAKVIIGKYCWLGAGCKIMPGVILGDFTIVGAGAVVTKSFPEGHCLIGGVPAKKIKELDQAQCVRYDLEPKFHGYVSANKFDNYLRKHLSV